MFNLYISIYNKEIKNLFKYYKDYVLYKAKKDEVLLSLSGLNVIKYNNEIFVPLGKTDKDINILPPYNGVGDHLIFKVSKNTYYIPSDFKLYNKYRSEKYTYIEQFVYPKKPILPLGLFWFHTNVMRPGVIEKIIQKIKLYPNHFMLADKFVNANYNQFLRKFVNRELAPNSWQMLFQFNHFFNNEDVIDNKKILYKLLKKITKILVGMIFLF